MKSWEEKRLNWFQECCHSIFRVLKICYFFRCLCFSLECLTLMRWRSESRVMSMFYVIKFHEHFPLSRNWKAWSCQRDTHTHTHLQKASKKAGRKTNPNFFWAINICYINHISMLFFFLLFFIHFSSCFNLYLTIHNPITVIHSWNYMRTPNI